MKTYKKLVFTALCAVLTLSTNNTVSAALDTKYDAPNYEHNITDDRLIHVYKHQDSQHRYDSHRHFEQSGRRTIETRMKYFESDRVQISHDYGSKFSESSNPSFHSMLRFSLKF